MNYLMSLRNTTTLFFLIKPLTRSSFPEENQIKHAPSKCSLGHIVTDSTISEDQQKWPLKNCADIISPALSRNK